MEVKQRQLEAVDIYQHMFAEVPEEQMTRNHHKQRALGEKKPNLYRKSHQEEAVEVYRALLEKQKTNKEGRTFLRQKAIKSPETEYCGDPGNKGGLSSPLHCHFKPHPKR